MGVLDFSSSGGKVEEVVKIDRVAVNLAIIGLKIFGLSSSPLRKMGKPPGFCCYQLLESFMLLPLEEQWVQRGIVNGELSGIPKTVHFSRSFIPPRRKRFPPDSRPFVPEFLLFWTPQLRWRPSLLSFHI